MHEFPNVLQVVSNKIQAGLSRATLEISSEISSELFSYFPLRTLILYVLRSPQSDIVVAEKFNF